VNQAEQTHLTSCAQEGATLLFQVTPSEPRFTVTNEEFAHKVRLHLRCPQLAKYSAEQAAKCKSCHFLKDNISAPQHIVNCGVRGGPQLRHDNVRDTFQSMFRSGHFHVRTEVRAELPHTGNGGPDLQVTDFPSNGQLTLYDVSVINPIQKQYIATGCAKGLVAAAARGKQKIEEYRKTAEAIGGRIVPLIFETTGAFGTETKQTIHSFAKRYQEKFGEDQSPSGSAVFPATDPSVYWKHMLAVTLAKGNYAMSLCIDRAGISSSAAGGPPSRRYQSVC